MFTKRFVWSVASVVTALGFAVGVPAVGLAQPAAPAGGPRPHAAESPSAASLAGEIRELRSHVARIEDALRRSSPKGGMSSGMGESGGKMMGKDMMGMDPGPRFVVSI